MNGNSEGNLGGNVYLSDIWVMDSKSNQWFWINGEMTLTNVESYGQKSVTSS